MVKSVAPDLDPSTKIVDTPIPIDSIIPYSNNSRSHPEEQIRSLMASIKRFGFTQPVIIDENKTLLAGHGRLEAAKRLKLDQIPARIIAGLSADEKRAYVIADNKIAEQSLWDTEKLLTELHSLEGLDLGADLNDLLDHNTFVSTKVEQVPIGKLKPHPKNYKTHPEAQIQHLKQSIVEHGIYRNIIITTDGTILAGHGVHQAAIALGLTSLPCLRVSLDPFETKALKLLTADNEISHIADSNARDLTDILKTVLQDGDLLGTGYDTEKLEALLLVSRSKHELLNSDEEWDEDIDFSPLAPAIKCSVSFENEKDRADFFQRLNIDHTDKTVRIWWPAKERRKLEDKVWMAEEDLDV